MLTKTRRLELERAPDKNSRLERAPNEVTIWICGYLDAVCLSMCSAVSQRWYKAARTRSLWRALLGGRYPGVLAGVGATCADERALYARLSRDVERAWRPTTPAEVLVHVEITRVREAMSEYSSWEDDVNYEELEVIASVTVPLDELQRQSAATGLGPGCYRIGQATLFPSTSSRLNELCVEAETNRAWQKSRDDRAEQIRALAASEEPVCFGDATDQATAELGGVDKIIPALLMVLTLVRTRDCAVIRVNSDYAVHPRGGLSNSDLSWDGTISPNNATQSYSRLVGTKIDGNQQDELYFNAVVWNSFAAMIEEERVEEVGAPEEPQDVFKTGDISLTFQQAVISFDRDSDEEDPWEDPWEPMRYSKRISRENEVSELSARVLSSLEWVC